MRKLLPVLLALIGLGGGVGAGLFLAPDKEAVMVAATECTCPPADGATAHAEDGHGEAGQGPPEPIPVLAQKDAEGGGQDAQVDYVKLNNQFVVPVVKDGRVASLVVMSLSVEVALGGRDDVFTREPKLRDVFLQVLFEHANAGGFDGNFTSGLNMAALRSGLLASAQKVLGSGVSDVLIQDIARQDS
jgi:hypothetical protein